MKNKKIISLLLASSMLIPAGVYAYQLQIVEKNKDLYTHEKIIGKDRYETGIKVAQRIGNLNNLIVVNGTDMADGLSASALSGDIGATIVPIKKNEIPKTSKETIKKADKVYIIGEKNAISKSVENEIKDYGITVERIGGKDRIETSELVAKKLKNYDEAYIVNGYTGQADAMSISSVSAKYKRPILLTNGKNPYHIRKGNVKYTVIGGKTVVNNEISNYFDAERIAGDTRYETNREVIKRFYPNSDKRAFANGETLVDALSGAYFSKDMGIVLVNKDKNHDLLQKMNTVQIGGMDFEMEFEENTNFKQTARLELLNEKDMLDIQAIPMTKKYAMDNIKPHTFTVKNTGNVNLDTKICIHMAEKTMPIDLSLVNVYITDINGNVISDTTMDKCNIKNAEKSFVLNAGDEKSFKMIAWIDEKAVEQDINAGDIVFNINAIGDMIVK